MKNVFDTLFDELLGEAAATPRQEVEMLFEERELVLRARMSLDGQYIVTDLFPYDLDLFRPESRGTLDRALLMINGAAAGAASYSVSIDGRNILVLTGKIPTADLDLDRYLAELAHWLDVSEELRRVVSAIGFENYAVTVVSP